MERIRMVQTMNRERVQSRLEIGLERRDLMSHIIQHTRSSPSSALSRGDIELNAMLIITAGSEPVTTALVGTLNYLLGNSSALEKLNKEVRGAFESKEAITANAVKVLPYLNSVLQEDLRMCPTTLDGMRRETPKGGAVVAGHALPENTVVSFPQWAGYGSESNFPSASSFIPEKMAPWLRIW